MSGRYRKGAGSSAPQRPPLKALPSRTTTLDLRRASLTPKTVDPHYLTPQHRAWRDLIIARAGGRCEQPECGRSERRMFADHIKELKDGGNALDPANGQCLCGSCHSRKTAEARVRRLYGG
jgi:5-methylcytosine-specific restriction protein A